MRINLNFKKRIILFLIVSIELIIGSFFLFDYYQERIFHKLPDLDKVSVIDKENLIIQEEPELKYYWKFKPNTEIIDKPEWLSYKAKYTINADNLNERLNYSIEKPDNTFRILTLGDSFTFGHFVNTEDNWPEQFEDMLNEFSEKNCEDKKFEVINLGMPGYDIKHIAKRYKDIGAKYKPDLIIWFESGSGFTRANEFFDPIIEECEKNKDNSQREIDEKYFCWQKAEKEFLKKYSYEEINKMIMSYLDDFFSSLNQEKILFFTFKFSDENKSNSLEQWKQKYSNAAFSSTAPELHGSKELLPDGHPNIQGHKAIALSIFDYLDSNILDQLSLCKPDEL